MAITSRIFNVMQYEKHPETGETLLTEEQIKVALAHRTIKRWAYIAHDADVYSLQDEADNPDHKAGEVKPKHWHICIEMKSNAVEVSVIARWLGIADNYVNVAKGHGAFLDCVQYLTHEGEKQQSLGKRLYEDSRVVASPGFDFRAELDKRALNKVKYGRDLSEKDALRHEVLYGGMTLRQAREQFPLLYLEDVGTLERHRLRYISDIAPMPECRINLYVEGAGGIGKGLISKALARTLCNPDNNLMDDEVFFEVGADNTSFEGYDGQPVLIWNDCRAFTLLKKLGGRENVFNVFDTFPPNMKQNIKYGSVRLNNHINIVNSVQPWSEFLDGLAGEYMTAAGQVQKAEDKSQSYRRFPLFLVLHEEDYDLGMNKGVFDGTREFEQYMMMRNIQGSMRRIVSVCGDNMELRDASSGKLLAPVKKQVGMLEEKLTHKQVGTDEEIKAMFADYGTIKSAKKPVDENNLPGQMSIVNTSMDIEEDQHV